MVINNNSMSVSSNNSFHKDSSKKNLNRLGTTKEILLTSDLKKIANEYLELEGLKRKFVAAVKNNEEKLNFSEFLCNAKYKLKEEKLIYPVKPTQVNGLNILSVDGSSVVKKFMNVDFSFLKSIAVNYYFYKEGTQANISYFPDLGGFNNYSIQGNFINSEESVVENKVSFDMLFMELNLLNQIIKKRENIDIIILDGSVVITPINLLFSKDPELSEKYDRLLKEYHKLYSNCKEKGIILIGSIKDTRTSALCNIISDSILMLKPNWSYLNEFLEINYRQLIKYFGDLDLFNRLLEKSQRSCVFNCKQEIDKIRDTGIKKEIPYYFPLNFYAFYLKTTKFDTPCRIEFFTEETENIDKVIEKANLISSILIPISSYNEYYGLPIPQIEAHKRASFKNEEIKLLFNNLNRYLNKHGLMLLEKRRNRRPF
ncbi:MAG: hypothetical protein GF353_28495 [Candidatus Lokiarchaeota archaeon]|nr:hypothetical protein [Candidatus Lokiarchaeota archaeon]